MMMRRMNAIRRMARNAVLKRLPQGRALDIQTTDTYENEANGRLEFLSSRLWGLWSAPGSGSSPWTITPPPVFTDRLELTQFARGIVLGCEVAAANSRYVSDLPSDFVPDIEKIVPSGDDLSRLGEERALEHADLRHYGLHGYFLERICQDLRGEDFAALHHLSDLDCDLSSEYVWAVRDADARVKFLSFRLWQLGREVSLPFSGSDDRENWQEFVVTTMVSCELAGLMSREKTKALTREDLQAIEAETLSEWRKMPPASSD